MFYLFFQNKFQGITPGKRVQLQGRTLSMTPSQPRFTATNRLGTPQSAPTVRDRPSFVINIVSMSCVTWRRCFSHTNEYEENGQNFQVAYGLKRPFSSDYAFEYSAIRRFPRSADKSKGLRHFSTKVCEKVKEKGHTNYNEVADELVQEYFDSLPNPPSDQVGLGEFSNFSGSFKII